MRGQKTGSICGVGRSRSGSSLILLFAAFLASGCSQLAKQEFPPMILDQADLLDQQTEAWLTSFHYPRGFAFVIRSVDELPEALIGARADDLFAETAKESSEEDALENRGVFVLLSRKPALVQVRVGEKLHSLARWGGVIAGPDYIAKQSLAMNGDFDDAVRAIVPWLAQRLPETTELSRTRKLLLNDIMAEISSELEDFGLPSESFYGHYLLKPVLELRVRERIRFGSWWITYVVLGVLLLVAKWIVGAVFGVTAGGLERAALRSSRGLFKGVRTASDVARILLSIGLGLLFSIPSAASALLLSGSRLEDQIALKASGVPGVERLGFEPEEYRISTGLAIVALVLILRMAKGLTGQAWLVRMAVLPEDVQREAFENLEETSPARAFVLMILGTGGEAGVSPEDFEKAPFAHAYFSSALQDFYAALKWALLAQLFLPKPLSLAAVYFWIPPVVLGSVATLRALLQARRSPQGEVSPPSRLRWAVLLLGGGVLLFAAFRFSYPLLHGSAQSTMSPGGERLTADSKLALRAIGPIRIGMTIEEAEQALQGPLARAETAEGEDCYYVEPQQGPHGVSFMIIGGRIARIDISEPGITTLSGARVGDSEKHVLSLYPGRLEVTGHTYNETGHYLTFTPKDPADSNYRLIFETDGNVVTRFRAGRLPEVDLVEGCL